MRDGIGLLSVYHHERLPTGGAVDKGHPARAESWRSWLVDVEAWRAQPIEQLGWMSAGIHVSVVEGRAFLFSSSAVFSSTTVYEIAQRATCHARSRRLATLEQFVRLL